MKNRVIMGTASMLLAGAVFSAVHVLAQVTPPPPVNSGMTAEGLGGGPGATAVPQTTPGTGPATTTRGRGRGNNPAGRGRGAIEDPNAGLTNLALVAVATTSYVSGDQSINAINDGNTGGRGGGGVARYGNWPQGGTQWVEYTWGKPISTNKVDVLWYADGAGIQVPRASRLKYWNGTALVDIPNAKGLGIEAGAFNTTTFDEITTNRIRLEMDAQGGPQISTGITEFRVFDSGKSPAFPPVVRAGMERVAVPKANTYLNATVRQLARGGPGGANGATITWSKDTGPGQVTFANANSPSTSASFDQVGEYVLKLTAKLGELSTSDTVKVKVEPASPAQPLMSLTTTNYSLNSPLWNNRIKAQIVGWIPHCVEYIEKPEARATGGRGGVLGPGGLDNFIEAGKKLKGQPSARHIGYVFSNAWVHNTIESMCLANMVDAKGDAQILKAQADNRATLERWIPIILAAQEPDGYLQTAQTLGNGWGRWSVRGNHEGYVMGYFLESAEAHYNLTKGQDRRLYDAAKKCADCWVNNIGPGKREWYDGHQEMEKALVRFGRLVNEVEGAGKGQKYIDLAKYLLDARRNGSEYDQSHLPVVAQYEAVGHAVRASYTYAGMAAVMAETRDLDYQSATLSLWDNIVNKKLYITGGIGSGETSEGFGPNYSLRNQAYCESCSNCGQVFFQYNMNLAFHDSKYASLYEEALYNAVLGDVDLAGKNFCYTNSLDQTGAPSGAGPSQGIARYAWHGCPCCVGNIPRTLLQLPTWTYATSNDSLYVNMFIGSTMTVDKFMGSSVEMVQNTNYPWDGKVSMTVNPKVAKHFALRVRVPDRQVSKLYTAKPEIRGISGLSVNGAAVANPTIQDGYAVIDRDWKAGDKVEFTLPLQVQRYTADERVQADRGRVALRYGPLVYNIEAVDGNNTRNGVLPANAALTTEWRPEMLDGVMVIKGKFADGSDLTAIPNYARLNRGGHSLVWMLAQ